ncbi:MAG: nicotinate-nucleotide adenylyltransferase [Desulfobulbaceae bacterium]|nr:MAG: nicotinate-nucleotide adenylyltransferase [Desulfobulbaceae bacterium]
MTIAETGVIHGRFQILHNDHRTYLLAGKARCQHLIVGIANPDPSLTRAEETDSKRAGAAANPLTFYERLLLVRETLLAAGVAADAFTIVPFPINFPELLGYYVPLDATFFLTIYDDWGQKKLERFQELGLATEILWQRPLAEKGLTSTTIRQRILEDQPWQHLVPKPVAAMLTTLDIKKRLQERTGR